MTKTPEEMAREWLTAPPGETYSTEATIASLATLLRAVQLEALERCKKVADKWTADIVAAGDQFDKGGDIYRVAGVTQDIAAAIRDMMEGKPDARPPGDGT
jgi:hypothetical protein